MTKLREIDAMKANLGFKLDQRPELAALIDQMVEAPNITCAQIGLLGMIVEEALTAPETADIDQVSA